MDAWFPGAMPVAPKPTRAGVLGMALIMRVPAGQACSIFSRVMPAAIEISKWSLLRAGAISSSIWVMYWGLTANKIVSALDAKSTLLVAAEAPQLLMVDAIESGFGSKTIISEDVVMSDFAIPPMRALPILPHPIKPIFMTEN